LSFEFLILNEKTEFSFIHCFPDESDEERPLQNTQCIPAVTRSEASALKFSPSLSACNAQAGLILNKIEHFSKVSLLL